jgi:pyridoxine/pyridoxamine 5'-phosphate oxidase
MNEERPYLLETEMPSKDPFVFFDAWFRSVASKTDLSFEEVNAVSIATSDQFAFYFRLCLFNCF